MHLGSVRGSRTAAALARPGVTGGLVPAEPDLTNLFAESIPQDAIFEGSYTVHHVAEPHSPEFYLSSAHIGQLIGLAFSTTDHTP